MEIERKFRVVNNDWRAEVSASEYCAQAYFPTDNPEIVVRVRILGDKGFLTIKGPQVGISRPEFEYPVPVADAKAMMASLTTGNITKVRHYVPAGNGLVWEIDEFEGANAGLIIAEIELPSESCEFQVPSWAGADESTNIRFTNSYLARFPWNPAIER